MAKMQDVSEANSSGPHVSAPTHGICNRVTRTTVARMNVKDGCVETQRQPRKLILFDLDGTLVNVAPLHLEAFRVAMQAVYGVDVAGVLDRQSYQGDTQPNVVRAACRVIGLSPATTEALLPDALRVASETTSALLGRHVGGMMLLGTVPLLEKLQQGGHVLGLVTGTISATAQAILEWAGLDHFSVRACGDEGKERADLVRLAIHRAAPLMGPQADEGNLVVIGDAPRDIETGNAFAARTVAVATGSHSADELARYHPIVVLPSLGDVEAAFVAILGTGDGPHDLG
jgi:phosphoglycolate phosphatase